MENHIFSNLNEKQKQAVEATDGPVLILAGPGSGKTRTLTARVAHLMASGVPADRILALTFTNKAAQEMRERIVQLVHDVGIVKNVRSVGTHDNSNNPPTGGDRTIRTSEVEPSSTKRSNVSNISNLPFIGTFHSFCARILRANALKLGYSPHFTIFDDDDSLGVIKEAIKEAGVDPKQFPAGMLKSVISGLKNELISPDEYAGQTDLSDMFPKTLHRVYEAYDRRLKESNGMDFDDLLVNTVRLFEKYPDILAAYQHKFLYIHVDEYQDTNHTQYVIVRELAREHRNIAVVGDDAQAIYGFRGADFRNILNFERDWPDATVIVLDENYRSTQTILDAARGVISKNALQKEKRLWTKQGHGEHIVLSPTRDERREAEFIRGTIESLLDEGRKIKDIAVLYRTNAQSRAIEEALLERNIPYVIVGGVKFFARKEIKDILAYVRVLQNPDDMVSLKRIINTPARGIGKVAFLAYLRRRIEKNQNGAVGKHENAISAFDELLDDFRAEIHKRKPTDLIKYILKKIRYKDYLTDGTENADERWENVEEFVSLAARYDDFPLPEGIQRMLEDAALTTEEEDDAKDRKQKIQLMTIHAAKGLEFPIVFIAGLEEGIFPHSKSLFSPRDLEEERRLCYVGLTRAKEKVYLSFALRRTRFGGVEINPPSRFLSEIPEELILVAEDDLDEVTID